MSRLLRWSLGALVALSVTVVLFGASSGRDGAVSGSVWPWLLSGGFLLAAAAGFQAARAPDITGPTRAIAFGTIGAALVLFGTAVIEVALPIPGWVEGLRLLAAFALVGSAIAYFLFLAIDGEAATWLAPNAHTPGGTNHRSSVTFAAIGVAATAVMILSGVLTSGMSRLDCPGWPFCGEGTVAPLNPSLAAFLQLAHRVAAMVGVVCLVAVAWITHRRSAPPLVRRLSEWGLGVLAIQVLLGGNLVVSGGVRLFRDSHLVIAMVLWGMGVATLAILVRARPASVVARDALGADGAVVAGGASLMVVRSGSASIVAAATALPPPVRGLAWSNVVPRRPSGAAIRRTMSDYVALTKPGILTLLLTTMLCAMIVANPLGVSVLLMVATLLGGAFVAGGANVLNCYIDRDIDAVMTRTRHRASAAGRISPRAVLTFGIALSALAVLELGLFVNWLAAGLALAGNLFYVLVYTRWLKRRTPHNIVIGGAAGAVPPLVGWAAATGELAPAAWLLFAIIFAWTPPHSWALALLKQGEYGRAAVPMLPVVAGEEMTRRQIVIYSAALFFVSLLLVPAGLGVVYFVSALLLNAIFLGLAVALLVKPSKLLARRLFFYSLWYLALIFASAVVDRLILG